MLEKNRLLWPLTLGLGLMLACASVFLTAEILVQLSGAADGALAAPVFGFSQLLVGASVLISVTLNLRLSATINDTRLLMNRIGITLLMATTLSVTLILYSDLIDRFGTRVIAAEQAFTGLFVGSTPFDLMFGAVAITVAISFLKELPNRWKQGNKSVKLLLLIGAPVFGAIAYFSTTIILTSGVLAGLGILLVGTRPANSLVTPRHLKMGIHYLLAVLALHGFAWLILPLSVFPALPFIWASASLLVVSLAYVTGCPNLLAKRGRCHTFLRQCLLTPYILGCKLNWLAWRRHLPLAVEVQPNVWIGRRPAAGEWEHIQRLGVTTVIDLAPELPGAPPAHMTHIVIPLLDLTVPDPAHLARVAAEIKAAKSKGVFVHCALGLSRSVLAARAYLTTQSKSPTEAQRQIDRVQPRRARQPFMQVAMQLFDQAQAERKEMPS